MNAEDEYFQNHRRVGGCNHHGDFFDEECFWCRQARIAMERNRFKKKDECGRNEIVGKVAGQGRSGA